MQRVLRDRDGRIGVLVELRVPEGILRAVCDFFRFVDRAAQVHVEMFEPRGWRLERKLRGVCEVCGDAIDRDYGLCAECLNREDIERNGPRLPFNVAGADDRLLDALDPLEGIRLCQNDMAAAMVRIADSLETIREWFIKHGESVSIDGGPN